MFRSWVGLGWVGMGNPPTPRPAGGRAWRGYLPEQKALAREAYALWRDLARERANPYGDHSGCLLAGRMAIEATRWEDGFVILDAIKDRMDSKSSPRWIPEWAREKGAQKRELENLARKQEERAAEQSRQAPSVPEDLIRCGRCGHWPHRTPDCQCCVAKTYLPPWAAESREPSLKHIGEGKP